MTPKPLGTYVLVEIPEVSEVSAGGIVLHSTESEKKREERAAEQGRVIAIGPAAFKGWAGCESPRWADMVGSAPAHLADVLAEYWKWNDPEHPPHKQWGFDVGDRVEFRKYEGKDCFQEGYERYRYIPDTHIVGVIHE